MGLQYKYREHQSWWRRHSLSIALTMLLIAQMIGYHFTLIPEWTSEQISHGESTAMWPAYWQHYLAEWFITTLADTYGALLLVLFGKWFFEEGSPESEDG